MILKSRYYSTPNNSKAVQDTYNGRPIESRIWSIEQRHFQFSNVNLGNVVISRRANEGRTRDSVRGDAWRCGSGEVVRATSWRNFWNVKKIISKVSRLVTTKLLSARAWQWVSRISWTVRNLCVTDGTTYRKLCVIHLAVLTDLACHLAGYCGNKIHTSVRLALDC